MIKPTRFHQTFTGKLNRHYEKCKHLTVITVAFINAHVLDCLSYNRNIPYSLFFFICGFVVFVYVHVHIYVYMARDKACAYRKRAQVKSCDIETLIFGLF